MGKVVASLKSRSCWVLWVWVCSWLILAPKMLQLCTCCLVLCRSVWVSDYLSFFLVLSQSSSTALYPQSATNQGVCPNFLLFCCFHFRFTFESIKELGNVSLSLGNWGCLFKEKCNLFQAFMLNINCQCIRKNVNKFGLN